MATTSMSTWMAAWEGDLTPSPAARRSAARVEARARSQSSRYYGREATARLPEPLPQAERVEAVPVLRVVTRRRPRWGLVTALVALALVLVGSAVVAPVMINSATTQVESAVADLEAQQQELTADRSALAAQISSMSSPRRVAEQAAQLGLVPAEKVHYVTVESVLSVTEDDTTVAGR